MNFLILAFLFVPILITQNLYAEVIDVPTNKHPTIQSAIDAANTGDEIRVAPGTYYEKIDYKGKAIRLFSSNGAESTIIDGNESCPVVQCATQEGPNTILEGFTITGAYGNWNDPAGGMQIAGSNPTVINCTFRFNHVKSGAAGGMLISRSNAKITNCEFTSNSSDCGGAIVIIEDSNPTITNSTFTDNTAMSGGGIYISNSTFGIDTGRGGTDGWSAPVSNEFFSEAWTAEVCAG